MKNPILNQVRSIYPPLTAIALGFFLLFFHFVGLDLRFDIVNQAYDLAVQFDLHARSLQFKTPANKSRSLRQYNSLLPWQIYSFSGFQDVVLIIHLDAAFNLQLFQLLLAQEHPGDFARGFRNLAVAVVIKESWLLDYRFFLVFVIIGLLTHNLPDFAAIFHLSAPKIFDVESRFRQIIQRINWIFLDFSLRLGDCFKDLVSHPSQGEKYGQQQN